MKSKNFAKQLILFLKLQKNQTASFEKISKTFDDPYETQKAIEDARHSMWISKIDDEKYQLTDKGKHEIKKMTKSQETTFEANLKFVKFSHCVKCGAQTTQGICPHCDQ